MQPNINFSRLKTTNEGIQDRNKLFANVKIKPRASVFETDENMREFSTMTKLLQEMKEKHNTYSNEEDNEDQYQHL